MKTLLLLSALLGTNLAWPAGTIHSVTYIEVGKQFLLGGGQPGSFTVKGKNVGPAAVEIREQPRSGLAVHRGRLTPGEKGQVTFAAGSTAVLVNEGDRKAVLNLEITGDNRSLRMTYVPAER